MNEAKGQYRAASQSKTNEEDGKMEKTPTVDSDVGSRRVLGRSCDPRLPYLGMASLVRRCPKLPWV